MRAWFQKIAAGHAIPDTPDTEPHPPDRIFTAAQRLNYDVLFIVFTLCSEWTSATRELSSVCRLWRYVALSMPQLWSRIDIGALNKPSNLRKFLERSKPLPLHILIQSTLSHVQSKVLSSATDRIICMTMWDSAPFLRHQFPILEQLDLDIPLAADNRKIDGLQYLSQASRFPQLREIRLNKVSTHALGQISPQQIGFKGLQKLDIVCGGTRHWPGIVQSVSNTIVSLVLFEPTDTTHRFSFPQLRHLKITQGSDIRLVLDIDAPRLESVEHGFLVGCSDGILLRLRNPRSVKQLCVECDPFDLTPYPALRKLWMKGLRGYNHIILQSLRAQIASCPELEALFYCAEPRYAGYRYPRNGRAFLAILDLVRETGRDIAVNEFLPTELDLPGAIKRRTGCVGSPCHRE